MSAESDDYASGWTPRSRWWARFWRREQDKKRGLYGKYRVTRLEDWYGKHDKCRYFVLDPKHDPIARDALAKYAEVAHAQGFIALADDLDAWLGKRVTRPDLPTPPTQREATP